MSSVQKAANLGGATDALSMQENVLHQTPPCVVAWLHVQLRRFDKRKIKRKHAGRRVRQSDGGLI